MTRWQRLAETNPSASSEQQVLLGLMVAAELDNSASSQRADPESARASPAAPTPVNSDEIS